ncbi:hypothetical protein L6452_30724 [Arctium lappa]|uniref:Uncharacterized protein n=1 Tax=Arctium lappa TaxID=4217 RepID=A0ACB8ZJY1_ARCLA|nr:hypothetical protein L6452_30724 [Arctium lappa]
MQKFMNIEDLVKNEIEKHEPEGQPFGNLGCLTPSENEQLAFCPAIIVPGVYYSDDKLLQTRIFSYADTQRHRVYNLF